MRRITDHGSLYGYVAVTLIMLSACTQPATPVSAASPTATSTPAATALPDVDFSKATPVDEAYRAKFTECDQQNTFGGIPMEGWKKCSSDPNRLTKLVRFPAATGLPVSAVVYTSKLGVDYDGSWVAAHTPGMTDQKDTSLELPGPDGKPVPTEL